MDRIKMKKVAFGMLIAALAFGFSAFKTIKKRTNVYIYYKVNHTYPLANDPRGYVYLDGDWCAAGFKVCHAQWDIGYSNPAPVNGDPLPTTGVTFQTGFAYQGYYDPE